MKGIDREKEGIGNNRQKLKGKTAEAKKKQTETAETMQKIKLRFCKSHGCQEHKNRIKI